MVLPTKTTIRKPDLGVVLNSNPIPLGDHHRSYRGIFDICVESLSDSSQTEIDRDALIKQEEYATAGRIRNSSALTPQHNTSAPLVLSKLSSTNFR